jgi:hypothetical protein
MLNSEQAKAELEKLKNEDWAAARMAAADGLQEGLRETARSILGADRPAQPALREKKQYQQIVKSFLAMDENARLRFFETMAPGLGAAIERGWQLLDRLPFQSGFQRKPFRAPGRPGVLITRRVKWLLSLLGVIGPYQQNIAWFAAWTPHLAHYLAADTLGILFAAVMDGGGADGEEVFQILCASGRNEHDIGAMGRHVTRALLTANRPDGWQFVENMLLAAQREEGLRQVILETSDEAHPQAFRRMLKLILDQNLARFSATVRAFDVWLGYQWGAPSGNVVSQTIEKMLLYLEDAAARDAALKGKEAEQVYLSLWAQAFDDAVATVAPASQLLKRANAEHRFVAAHLLHQLGLVASHKNLLAALEDADLRVATRALLAFHAGADNRVKDADLFERLEKLLPRCPDRPEKLQPTVWPWTAYEISRELVADALPKNLGKRAPNRLIPHLPHMGVRSRVAVVGLLGAQENWNAEARDTLFALVGDASRTVRERAVQYLAKCQITPQEAVGMEKLLDRKTGDLRRAVLTLLSSQIDARALDSADRLLAAPSQPQRLASLEMLRHLVENKRCVPEARARAEQYSTTHPKLNEAERQQIEVVLAVGAEVPTLANALGLISHADRTWPPAPIARGVQFHSAAARKIVIEIDEIFKANAQQVVSFKKSDGEIWKGLLSDLKYGFPKPDAKLPIDEDRQRLPMAEVWENWWQTRGSEFRDADKMELPRALAWFKFACAPHYRPAAMLQAFPEAAKIVFGELPETKAERNWEVASVLDWLLRLFPPTGGVEFSLDAAESALALVSRESLQFTEQEAAKTKELDESSGDFGQHDWRKIQARTALMQSKAGWREAHAPFLAWPLVARVFFDHAPQLWRPALHARHWKLLRWLDEPVRSQETGGVTGPSASRCLPRLRAAMLDLCFAHTDGGSTEADIIEHLIGERGLGVHYGQDRFDDLQTLTKRRPKPELARFKFLFPLAERCRKRILEVELTRGDNPTAASMPALRLGSVEGIANLAAILRTLGKRNFVRGWSRDNQSMETVLSHLARCCFPLAGETASNFSHAMKSSSIAEKRLVELAVYAPQWAALVEQALNWRSLAEAVWWIHAHTKGQDWTVDREILDLWEADMNARTALNSADLLEGGVDVAWFHRMHKELGAKRWDAVCDAAKFASTGAGHARAMLFAKAMLGDVSKKELVQRVTKKRHQDAVRAMGLLPLAAGKRRETDLLDRYKIIQEFRRGSKAFGSMRQASEKRAAQIGQQNLARTAEFTDPIRLEWAMEAKAVEISVEGVKVSLGIDPWGEIELSAEKEGKTLADIPTKLKKHPKIAALRTRKLELKRQASRIRPSLEQFMVRGDEFTGAELVDLMGHPLLAPMLKNLVIVGEGIMGYPVHGGKALENYAGQVEAVKAAEKLRVAHPHDLLPAAHWSQWQKDCFARERIQPFKQVFRELYPLTQTERNEGLQTRRYAGHQVQPRQALALLGQRGWVYHPEEGVRKVFHEAGLVAWLHFQQGFHTPAEIEGLTLESVFFTKRGEYQAIKLDQLPPRLFSETMRDLDLVVSVAHRGGVDPEASASTIEMRTTLVQETMRLLKLSNVELKDRYALIKGELGEYSVHLGSAVTRKMPGETLFIVAVHSQHRGRLFLPFADDDPRTAEVMSKVLLLARDKEIKDPNILDQIRQS